MPKIPQTQKVKIYIHLSPYTNEIKLCSASMSNLGWPLIGEQECVVEIPEIDQVDISIARQQAIVDELLSKQEKCEEEIKEAFAALNRLRVKRETGGDEYA